MKPLPVIKLLLIILIPIHPLAETLIGGRPSLVLEHEQARLVVDLAGGSFREFRFVDQPLNPLNWNPPASNQTSPMVMGHFLCLDRWGPPSKAEGANGMPYHGEAGKVLWNLDDEVHQPGGMLQARMTATLPMAGLKIDRTVQLAPRSTVALVSETVTNQNALGRPYNMVQHPSIAPPFLQESTIVDANGRKGFAQGGTLPFPETPSFYWPQALNRDGEIVNLRYLTTHHQPNVVSFTIDDPIGWVTAASPNHGLLIGYFWPTKDYPWLDIWRHSAEGKPAARGLEFGTTGLHQPFPILMEKGRIFGRKLFDYLDANQSATRRYATFLLRIPSDFSGVEKLDLTEDRIEVQERQDGKGRSFSISFEGLDIRF